MVETVLGFIFKFLEILSGIGEACGIGDDFFMGTCSPGLSCNHGLCNITCNIRIHEWYQMTKPFLCTQTFCLLIAALYDIGPDVKIRRDDKPGKIYEVRINLAQSNWYH